VKRFKFVHASDLHLDTPFSQISTTKPEVAQALRDASLLAWDRLVQLVFDQGASFLFVAGDIYDGPERGPRAQIRFLKGLKRLSQEGVSVFLVFGNHDPLEGWSAIRGWPDGVFIFGGEKVETIETNSREGVPILVHGISYAKKETQENLASRFARDPRHIFQIGILHCTVGKPAGHAPYAPCSLDDLRKARMDYWALGHVHSHSVLQDSDPCVVYSGCLQGRSPSPAEKGQKGAVVVTCEDGRVRDIDFHALDQVRFGEIDVDINGLENMASLQEECWLSAERLIEKQNGDLEWIVRASLVGRGLLHWELSRPGVVKEFLLTLQDRELIHPFIWFDRLEVQTRSEIDRDSIRSQESLSGELVRKVDSLLSDDEKRNRLIRKIQEETEQLIPSQWMPRTNTWRSRIQLAEQKLLDLLEREEGD